MTESDILPVNFTISAVAKQAIERIRQDWDEQFPDPAAVAMIGWGIFNLNSGQKGENVVVSFYAESQLAEVAHAVQEVSGLKVVFFTTPEYYPNFEGKILDFADDRWFFLRNP